MLVLHASWVLDQRLGSGALVFWGEIEKPAPSTTARPAGKRDAGAKAHPFAASNPRLTSSLNAAVDAPMLGRAQRAFITLPTTDGRPLASHADPVHDSS